MESEKPFYKMTLEEKRISQIQWWINYYKETLEKYNSESAFSIEYLTQELHYWQYEEKKINEDVIVEKYILEEIGDTLRQVKNYIRKKEINDLPPSSLYRSIAKNETWINSLLNKE